MFSIKSYSYNFYILFFEGCTEGKLATADKSKNFVFYFCVNNQHQYWLAKDEESWIGRKASVKAFHKGFELIPEAPSSPEIQSVLVDIQMMNSNLTLEQHVFTMLFSPILRLAMFFLIISIIFIVVLKVWDTTYCPKDTHCRCCFSFLSSETKLQGGRGSFWRLTKCGIHSINVV